MRLKGLQLLLSRSNQSPPCFHHINEGTVKSADSKLKTQTPIKLSQEIDHYRVDFLPPHLVPLGTFFPHFLATKTAFSKLILLSIPGGRFSHRHGKSSFLISAQHALEGFTLGPGILTYFLHSARRSPRSAPQILICALAGEVVESSRAATMAIEQTKRGALCCAMMKLAKIGSLYRLLVFLYACMLWQKKNWTGIFALSAWDLDFIFGRLRKLFPFDGF